MIQSEAQARTGTNPSGLAHSPSPIQVLFALLPDSLALDWAGPAEALRIANQALQVQGLPSRFELRFIGPCANPVSSVGLKLAGLEPLPDTLHEPTWVVLVGMPGRDIPVASEPARALLDWLRGLRLARQTLELVTVCAGSVLAAHAGLLAGRRVTTHHHHLQELQAVEPSCQVVANRVFVEDAPVYSSAGVTTGVDLMLHRIASTCGEVIAAQVAQTMVVAMRRGPQDPELSPFLSYRNHMHPALHRVQDAVSQQPAQDWSVRAMADIAHASSRHLTRLFMEHAGIGPLQYLRRIRLTVAQTALKSGHNVTQAAEMAGFSLDTQLRRTWHQFAAAGTPSVLKTLWGGRLRKRKIKHVKPVVTVVEVACQPVHAVAPPPCRPRGRRPAAFQVRDVACPCRKPYR